MGSPESSPVSKLTYPEERLNPGWEAGIRHQTLELPGLPVHLVTAGPEDGFPVILLHGFPDFWYSWRFQIPALAQAGYRVIAPDQRGYNISGKQPPYVLDTLVQDIVHLQDALGVQKSLVAGHDWGGVVAYTFAARHPARTERLVVLNAPHLPAYVDTVKHHPIQLIKSYYVLFFQIPHLPEWTLSTRNYRGIENAFRSIPRRVMSEADIQRYKTACAQPGALTAMIGWYRANFQFKRALSGRGTPPEWSVKPPTQVIWGLQDPFLDRQCNETLPEYVPDLRVQYFPDAGHWVQMERAPAVNRILLDFFRAS